MHLMDLSTLEGAVVSSSLKWGLTTRIQNLTPGPCIGDHGDDYEIQKPYPANFVAILNCGCRLNFPQPPMTGELLFCQVHDDWFKCQVPGGEVIRCDTCSYRLEVGHNASLASSKAKKHAFGSKGGRKNSAHEVFIGKYTTEKNVLNWRRYEPKNLKEN